MPERHFRTALLLIGHGVFLSLLALAWKYALVRSTWGDTAFQTFQWISQPGWDIEAHRYTAIVPQAAVKFFALFGPDLRTLLVVGSLAHVLVAYAIYALCAHVWRAPVAAFGCAVAAVLCSRLAFYSPVLEAGYLLSYPFLLIGFVEHHAGVDRLPWWKVLVGLLLLWVALTVHPVGWMVMLFCVVFMYALGWLRKGMFVRLTLLTALWPLIARWLFPPTGYEQEQYDAVSKGFQKLGSFASWGSWQFLSIHTMGSSNTYLPALIVLVLVVSGWAIQRKAWYAFLTLAGSMAYVAVFLVTFHTGNSAVMQDRGVLPLATILALPAAACMVRLGQPRARPPVLLLAALVLFIKVRDVSFASRSFVDQYRVTKELIALAADQGIDRAVVDCQRIRELGVEIAWAFPVETLLRSAVEGPDQGRVLVCSDQLPDAKILSSGGLEVIGMTWDTDRNGNHYFRQTGAPYRNLVWK